MRSGTRCACVHFCRMVEPKLIFSKVPSANRSRGPLRRRGARLRSRCEVGEGHVCRARRRARSPRAGGGGRLAAARGGCDVDVPVDGHGRTTRRRRRRKSRSRARPARISCSPGRRPAWTIRRTRRRARAACPSRRRTSASSTPTGRARRRRRRSRCSARRSASCGNSLASTYYNVIWGARAPVLAEPLLHGLSWSATGGAQNDVTSSNDYVGTESITVPAFPMPVLGREGAVADHAGGRARRSVRKRRAHDLVGVRRRPGEGRLPARGRQRRAGDDGRCCSRRTRRRQRRRPTRRTSR